MDNTKFSLIVSRIALVAAMVVLVGCAVFGIIKIIPSALSSLAGAGTSLKSALFLTKEPVTVSLPQNSIKSGEQTDLSYNQNKDYEYQLRIECSSRDFSALVIDGSHQTDIQCGSKIPVTQNTLRIIPTFKTQNSFVDVSIFIEGFKKNTSVVAASGYAILTVHTDTSRGANKNPVPTQQVTVSTSSVQQPPVQQHTEVSKPTGKPDLNVTFKDSGVILNGAYIPKTTFSANENPSIRFDIGNQGSANTGSWKFVAILPTNPSTVFSSPVQPSLAPGEIIEYTLTLENLAQNGANIVSINASTLQQNNEVSTVNNALLITLIGNQTYTTQAWSQPNSYSQNSSTADLSGRVVATGYIDRSSGTFYQSTSVSLSQRAGIQLEITNVGGTPSGDFTITAELPSSVNSFYTSPVQYSLAPGEKRLFTIGFDSPRYTGVNAATIHINGNTGDSNTYNNTITATVNVY